MARLRRRDTDLNATSSMCLGTSHPGRCPGTGGSALRETWAGVTRPARPHSSAPVALARAYFAVQAVAGAAWWVAVFASDDVGAVDARRVGPGAARRTGPGAVRRGIGVGRAAGQPDRRGRRRGVDDGDDHAPWRSTGSSSTAGRLGRRRSCPGHARDAGGRPRSSGSGWLPTAALLRRPVRVPRGRRGAGGRHLRRSLAQLVVFWTTFFVLVPLVVVGGRGAAAHRPGRHSTTRGGRSSARVVLPAAARSACGRA